MNVRETLEAINNGRFLNIFSQIYPGISADLQNARYSQVVKGFEELFGDQRDIQFFSAPGRTELGGNHTDHQHGKVLAAAVNLDIVCAVSKNDDNVIRVKSEGHDQANVNLSSLDPVSNECGSSISLVRGIAARCRELGFNIGGFDAYTVSDVPKGSGLSSSAAFEVVVGTIISHLFNKGTIPAQLIAKIGQYAENRYFGKPSGLMDQMASSCGGLVAIDFENSDNPIIEKVGFDFNSCGHTLCIVNTGGSHSDLTSEYAAIPVEMRGIAHEFGKDCLRGVPETDFFEAIPSLRIKHGDRAVLRAVHFFSDNARVPYMADALRAGDFELFKQLSIKSGESSLLCLQNIFVPGDTKEQGLALALAISKQLLDGKGAWRVHGGGFAGTIQAFVPDNLLGEYVREMERLFGDGSCLQLTVRPVGGIVINP